MDMQDLKLALINLFTFSMSFSNVELGLKLVLLTVSIVYTVLKIVNLKKKNE